MHKLVGRYSLPSIVMIIAASFVLSTAYLTISFSLNFVHADAYIRMRNGRKVFVGPDGAKIVITNWGEHAIIAQSITYNGLTRFAMVSDNARVVTNVVNVSAGQLSVGYLIGCQFPEGGAQIIAQLNVNPGNYFLGVYPTPTLSVTTAASVEGGVYTPTVPFTPGTISSLQVDNDEISNGAAMVQLSDVEITAQGPGSAGPNSQVPCAGYAQARSYQRVDISSPLGYVISSTLYGQSFGIG